MKKKPSFLAIVPARGGSKRLPGKNLADLGGKPLIAWSIEAALKSRYVTKIVVSTDDATIAHTAEQWGAEVPFLRPAELSAGTTEVLRHTLGFYEKRGEIFDFLILLQPTSPLRTAEHIDEAIIELMQKKAAAVISVCEMEHSPLWSNTLPEDLSLEHFIKEELKRVRSQDLPTYYRINGAIYICRTDEFLEQNTLFLNEKIYAYIMPKEASVDIDERLDLIVANAILASNPL